MIFDLAYFPVKLVCAHHHAGFKSDHKNIFSLQDLYFPSLDLPKHRNAAVRRNPVRYTLDTSVLFDSTRFYLGIGSPHPCLEASGDWGGGLGADLKKSSLAPLFFLTANKRLPSFTQTAYCRRREALASQDPLEKAWPL